MFPIIGSLGGEGGKLHLEASCFLKLITERTEVPKKKKKTKNKKTRRGSMKDIAGITCSMNLFFPVLLFC